MLVESKNSLVNWKFPDLQVTHNQKRVISSIAIGVIGCAMAFKHTRFFTAALISAGISSIAYQVLSSDKGKKPEFDVLELGIMKEDIIKFDTELKQNNPASFKKHILGLNREVIPILINAKYFEWALPNLRKLIELGALNEKECASLHIMLAGTGVFDLPQEQFEGVSLIAFMLASSVFRAMKTSKMQGITKRPKEHSPNLVKEYIHNRVIEVSSIESALEKYIVFRFWLLGDVQDWFFRNNREIVGILPKASTRTLEVWENVKSVAASVEHPEIATKLYEAFFNNILYEHGATVNREVEEDIYTVPADKLYLLLKQGEPYEILHQDTNAITISFKEGKITNLSIAKTFLQQRSTLAGNIESIVLQSDEQKVNFLKIRELFPYLPNLKRFAIVVNGNNNVVDLDAYPAVLKSKPGLELLLVNHTQNAIGCSSVFSQDELNPVRLGHVRQCIFNTHAVTLDFNAFCAANPTHTMTNSHMTVISGQFGDGRLNTQAFYGKLFSLNTQS